MPVASARSLGGLSLLAALQLAVGCATRSAGRDGKIYAIGPEEGFSLVELVDDVAAEARTFEQVKEKAALDLRTQGALARVEALVEERRKSATVEIDEAVLRDDAVFAELEQREAR